MPDLFDMQRKLMVERQIRRRGVSHENVLRAMEKVPRHLFVPPEHEAFAYSDTPLPIGFGQTISQPYIVAYMTEMLELTGVETVLELGGGSGYLAAVLAEIVPMVRTVEIIPELADAMRSRFQRLHYDNIAALTGDGRAGWPEFQPFDRMILSASPAEFPSKLFGQLAENGVIVAPVGDLYQRLIRYRKKKGAVIAEELIPVSFVPFV